MQKCSCFLNNLHPNYKFTYEIGSHKLAFLDTQISLSSNNDLSLITNVYRSQLTPKLSLIFMQFAHGIIKVAKLNVFSIELLLLATTGLHFIKKFLNRKIFFI